jgi:cohesin complex subunit SA-1/2
MLSSDIALAPLVEEWVENYQQTANDETSEKSAVHELVLFIVRACGLAVDVDEDEAMDVDGVGDVIERIQEESLEVGGAGESLDRMW